MTSESVWAAIFGTLVFLLGFLLGGGIQKQTHWVEALDGWGIEEGVQEAALVPASGPLTFTVAMNGTWEYECLNMAYIGETDPDFQP